MDTIDIAFPVRLADMRIADQRHAQADAETQARMHRRLVFYELLTLPERAALERRFPQELELEPSDPDAPYEVREVWDRRAHDLVRCMLAYGDEVIARHMDLVGAVQPEGRGAILALTATGSVVELGPPDGDNRRSYAYRPSPRAERGPMSGILMLTAPVKLGDPLRLSGRNTSEIIVLAAGLGAK